MKTFKVTYKYKYGRSHTYTDKIKAENLESLKAEWEILNATRKNPYKILSVKEI